MKNRNQTNNDHSTGAGRFICPTCKHPLKKASEGSSGLPRFFPFCSERCKLIDLGAWFDADYRIPAKPDEDSEESAGDNSPDR